MDDQDDADMEQRLINEGTSSVSNLLDSADRLADLCPEYKTWKKNSPFLYDMILR